MTKEQIIKELEAIIQNYEYLSSDYYPDEDCANEGWGISCIQLDDAQTPLKKLISKLELSAWEEAMRSQNPNKV